MSVYGKNSAVINFCTKPAPNNAYGKSKLEAEKLIQQLRSPEFLVTILRPPMIYGYNSPGNYSRISKLAKKFLYFQKWKINAVCYLSKTCIRFSNCLLIIT